MLRLPVLVEIQVNQRSRAATEQVELIESDSCSYHRTPAAASAPSSAFSHFSPAWVRSVAAELHSWSQVSPAWQCCRSRQDQCFGAAPGSSRPGSEWEESGISVRPLGQAERVFTGGGSLGGMTASSAERSSQRCQRFPSSRSDAPSLSPVLCMAVTVTHCVP